MQLVIGNKNYSSWSMRPWVLLRQFGIPFDEVMARFDGFVVWDTLAIAEFVAEKFPAAALWPRDAKRRARARSLCAEMHSGFGALRNLFGMNIEAALPEVGARLLAEHADLRADLARIFALWQAALAESGGPFLFGDYTIADAYFAPVVMRLRTYAPPQPADVAAYAARMVATRGVAAWIRDALEEKDFRPFEEPYRTSRD